MAETSCLASQSTWRTDRTGGGARLLHSGGWLMGVLLVGTALAQPDARALNLVTNGGFEGPTQGRRESVTVSDVPAGTREALVRWSGQQRNTTCASNIRIDADYLEPQGGFRPVRVTYLWDEGGAEKRHTHIATVPDETCPIECAAQPRMKSIILELAE